MFRSAVFAAALAFAGTSALAQTAPAAKPAAKPVKPAAKKKAAAPAPLPTADQNQLDAAERAHYGPYACDMNQTVNVSKNATSPGYVDLTFGKKVYTMKPVLSSTGALRLEDVKGVGLFIQIANKSMLMDTKAGKRLVDSCVHENQRAAAEAAAK